jgi:hypothetical protein
MTGESYGIAQWRLTSANFTRQLLGTSAVRYMPLFYLCFCRLRQNTSTDKLKLQRQQCWPDAKISEAIAHMSRHTRAGTMLLFGLSSWNNYLMRHLLLNRNHMVTLAPACLVPFRQLARSRWCCTIVTMHACCPHLEASEANYDNSW